VRFAHVHAGILFIIAVAAAVVLVNATARTVAAKNADKPWGRALAFTF
jgi:hypothetical protein